MRKITLNRKQGAKKFTIRKTVKAVIYDKKTFKVLLLNNLLIGGGLEKTETYSIALEREAMEEAGIKLRIIKEIGQVTQYRYFLNKKYIIKGFFCLYIKRVAEPITTKPEEKRFKLSWKKIELAIELLQTEIAELLINGPNKYGGDEYQSRLLNRQTTLFFLREARKIF